MRWYPVRTSTEYPRPEPGQLIALRHAVWRVEKVQDLPLSDTDRDKWLDAGMPNIATWRRRPYRVRAQWVAGAKPEWLTAAQTSAQMDIPADTYMTWHVYEGGRWPQCSCCGEPMPCWAELEDEQITASLNRVAKMEAIPPGACWACAEPITTRQKSITYPGDNLDLPGGQEPRFHIRSRCRSFAERYEEQWLAADPRRQRLLTWPSCGGILLVHADGDSECVVGRDPLGRDREPVPDCRGHDTHDHSVSVACYVRDDYFAGFWTDRCPRGCDPRNHPGAAPRRRPERRFPDPLVQEGELR
ncbi:hypothetical protein OHA25_61125 (plasmid) [Nonomuraea sp. NBC_00507]|uniref:hypothetical protein n=1 Tax=Nonomuraea sp. NBC_00507 TaxID=2976002 RepID=UPI002E1773BC